MIAINPENDEEPTVTIANVTCNEGDMEPLTIVIDDLDVPHDNVRLL